MNRKFTLLFLLLPIALAIGLSHAQTPMIVVPAASPALPVTTTTTATVATSPSDSASLASAIKLLHEMKAANAETLKKQEAVLQQLNELQKASEQMKAFGKRG